MTAITRPNGKPYRPRKPVAAETFVDHYEQTGVVVLRTHDVEAARKQYADLLAQHELWYAEGARDWWRLVPWDAGSGHDSSYIIDPIRGTACVVFAPS